MKSRVYSFFLVSYTMILLISLSSCLFFGAAVANQLRREDTLNRQALLLNLQSDVEENLRYVEELGNSLVFNAQLQFLVKHPSMASVHDTMNEMAAKVTPRDYLLDYFVYVRDTNQVITSTVRMDVDEFFDIIYKFTDVPYDTLKQTYLDAYHFQEYMPASALRQYHDEAQLMVVPYLQSIPISSSAPPPGQIILLLDYDKMFAQAGVLHETTSGNVYVLDEKDTLVYQTEGASPLPEDVLQSKSSMVRIDGVSYTRLLSAQTGWVYFISSSSSTLFFTDNLSTVVFLIGVFVVYLLFGLILVRRIALRSYRPVKDINDLIVAHAADGQQHNEFDLIKNTLLNQMRSGNEMQQVIDAQRPSVIRDLLLQLLLGQTNDAATTLQKLSGLEVSFAGDRVAVVMVELDFDSAFFLDTNIPLESNLSVARVVLHNVGCELFGKKMDCQYLGLGRSQGAFLLSLHPDIETQMALEFVQQQATALAAFCDKQFSLDIFIGISAVKQGIDQLPLGYDESRKALEYCQLQAGERILPVLFSALNITESDYYYPQEVEQQLSHSIRMSDAAAAQDILKRIFVVNFETKYISSTAARNLLYQLATTLQRIAHSDICSQTDEIDANMVEQIANSGNVEYARRRLSENIEQLALLHKKKSKSKTELLVERIGNYIDQCEKSEYPDLTVLSDEFGVTPQYISNIFKKHRNENIKDYIAKQKLAQAKTLLITTELSVREIAAQLGYAGEVGIIRLFRKYESTTPGDYRKQHK